MHETPGAIKARYQAALDAFVAKVRQDGYIIAAILAGSLSHDQVWEKSDIDILLVGRSEKAPERTYYLVEDGINIHAWLMSRSRFREQIERALQSSFFHSYFSKSTLLFATDETIAEYYANIQRLGARDRELQLLNAGTAHVQVRQIRVRHGSGAAEVIDEPSYVLAGQRRSWKLRSPVRPGTVETTPISLVSSA